MCANEAKSKCNDQHALKNDKTERHRRNTRSRIRQRWNQFRDYVRQETYEIFSNRNCEGTFDPAEVSSVDYELEKLINMTRIPFLLERLMFWALLACLDCFLYYFTIMPLRLIHGLIFRFKKGRALKLSTSHNERIMGFLIIVACFILSKLDTSKAYHRIKRQSSVKLYMLFGVLEMSDKMLASIGQSLLSVLLASKSAKRTNYQRILLLGTSVLYLVCHGFVMVYQTVALNVAVNSYSNALITLLLSLQFAEIKASLFKRTDKEGLFQLTIADLVERSQLILLLIIIAIRNLVAKSKSQSNLVPNSWALNATSSVIIGALCGPMFTVLGSELVVDWIKHAYVTKFNRIRPEIYHKFLYIMCEDHSVSLQKFRERLGLPIPAYVILFIVMVKPTLSQVMDKSSITSIAQNFLVMLLGFICLMIFKIVLHIIVLKWGQELRFGGHASTSLIEKDYVPGDVGAGSAKIDHRARCVINHDSDSNIHGSEKKASSANLISPSSASSPSIYQKQTVSTRLQATPFDVPTEKESHRDGSESRKVNSLKNRFGLGNVSRYKMVSKRIW